MKYIILILGLSLCSLSAFAQKSFELLPSPLTYHPKKIDVAPTGAVSSGAFQIYYRLSDTSGKDFESGNKRMPVEFFPLFTADSLNAEQKQTLKYILLLEDLHLKDDEE